MNIRDYIGGAGVRYWQALFVTAFLGAMVLLGRVADAMAAYV